MERLTKRTMIPYLKDREVVYAELIHENTDLEYALYEHGWEEKDTEELSDIQKINLLADSEDFVSHEVTYPELFYTAGFESVIDEEYQNRIILLAPGGSRGRHLETETSDWDIKGIYLPSASDLIGMGINKFHTKNTLGNHYGTKVEVCMKTVNTFIDELIKGCPGAIELVGLDKEQYFVNHYIGNGLLSYVPAFFNKNQYKSSFLGYTFNMLNQINTARNFEKGMLKGKCLNQRYLDDQEKTKIFKLEANLLHSCYLGIELFRDGVVNTHQKEHNQFLRDIRAGRFYKPHDDMMTNHLFFKENEDPMIYNHIQEARTELIQTIEKSPMKDFIDDEFVDRAVSSINMTMINMMSEMVDNFI